METQWRRVLIFPGGETLEIAPVPTYRSWVTYEQQGSWWPYVAVHVAAPPTMTIWFTRLDSRIGGPV